jgi:hypothetical protein
VKKNFDKQFLHSFLRERNYPKNSSFYVNLDKALCGRNLTMKVMACVALGCIAQRTTEFRLSRNEVIRILKLNPRAHTKNVSGKGWAKLRTELIENGYIEEVETASTTGFPGTKNPGKAALFRIVKPTILEQIQSL